MLSPEASLRETARKLGRSPGFVPIVPEFDMVEGRYREPQLRDACLALVRGAERLLIVTVFERRVLLRLPFAEILGQSFTQVVEMPVSGNELQAAFESMGVVPPATIEDRERFRRQLIGEWFGRLKNDIDHRLKSPRASLGALLASWDLDEAPKMGVHTTDSLTRGLAGLERYALEVEPIDAMLANRVEMGRTILKEALAYGDARQTARQLDQLDQVLGDMLEEEGHLGE